MLNGYLATFLVSSQTGMVNKSIDKINKMVLTHIRVKNSFAVK